MVDLSNLSRWPVDRVIAKVGFVCKNCGTREAVLYTNVSLDETLRKLSDCPPGHRKFQSLFAKALKRMVDIRERGEAHGEIRRPDMASS